MDASGRLLTLDTHTLHRRARGSGPADAPPGLLDPAKALGHAHIWCDILSHSPIGRFSPARLWGLSRDAPGIGGCPMEMALGRFGDRRLEKGGGAPRRNGAC